MAWPKYYVFIIAVVLVSSLAVMNAHELLADKESVIHLAHQCVRPHSLPEKGVPVIMLHGLTSAKETWNGIYQSLSFLTRRRVCIYDARNHGDSGWNDSFTADTVADDIGTFMHLRKIEKASLVGHSMGGFTAMKFALKNPDKVEKIFVEDISPIVSLIRFPAVNDSFTIMMVNVISIVPKDADEETAKKVIIDYIRKATGKEPDANTFFERFRLRCRNGVWQWKLNFAAFLKAFDDPETLAGKMEGRFDGRVFFIYGKDSPQKVANDIEATRKLFPNSDFLGIEGAGHKIHSLYPVFLRKMVEFLK